ncbi:hypothetical protein LLS1_25640 [Leifsonia sp. LS1]|uniref:DUF2247 family protein n=1 Tax=Leifsonia sp. LS1 TaxID=2828483 RepID=UPI001CFE8413|nr:DUF2247 family protein [Leifsonia sp. LS1]GIT80895.1 hypothetical protein LLS1_25640 [Leifsonia sp. LS1]
MSSDVRIAVSLDVAESFAPLLEADVRYGYERGLLRSEAVVAYCLGRLERGEKLSEAAESLALLLSDQLEDADALIRGLDSPVDQESRRLWIALCLDRARRLPEPGLAIENVYEFFDDDERLLPFVGWIHPGMASEADRLERLAVHLRSEKIWGHLRATGCLE